MVCRYAKIILLSLLVFIQTACPKYFTRQHEEVRMNSADHYRGGD